MKIEVHNLNRKVTVFKTLRCIRYNL